MAAVAIQRELGFGGAGLARGRELGHVEGHPPRAARDDSVRTLMPSAPSVMLTPLTFQKRVLVVTYLSYGAWTKIVTSTDWPSGASV
jgi:hypothetical protein